MLDLLPGNVAQVMLGESATPGGGGCARSQARPRPPAPVRYSIGCGLVTLDSPGTSHAYDSPSSIGGRAPAVTLPLALLAMTLTVVLALAAGLYAASRHNRAGDLGVMALSQLGIAVPSFWFGILLVMLFAVKLPWFPSGGFPRLERGRRRRPVGGLARWRCRPSRWRWCRLPSSRASRSAVLDVLREDFVRTARARGLSRRAVLGAMCCATPWCRCSR